MRNTKRFFISLFIAIFTMSMLAGCGGTTAATSGTTAATESKDKEPVVIDSNGEGAVQGGIRSDEEIAALQEEEAAFAAESDQPTEFEDNSGHEPEAYGSGNFQDYWEGEDYFDLEGYLRDIGCSEYYGTKMGSEDKISPDETPEAYIAYYKDWLIFIMPYSFCSVYHVTDSGSRDINYDFSSNPNLESIQILVNNKGTTITNGVIQELQLIINSINMCSDPNALKDIVYSQ